MIELLKEAKLFEGLLKEELEAIQKLCEACTSKKGSQVFKAGESADYLFVVVEGEIELRFEVVYSNAAVEIPLDKKRKGEAFGWSALIEPHKYTLSAVAAKDCELLRLRGRDIEKLCGESNHLGYVMMNNFAKLIGMRFSVLEKALIAEIQRSLKVKDPLA